MVLVDDDEGVSDRDDSDRPPAYPVLVLLPLLAILALLALGLGRDMSKSRYVRAP